MDLHLDEFSKACRYFMFIILFYDIGYLTIGKLKNYFVLSIRFFDTRIVRMKLYEMYDRFSLQTGKQIWPSKE